jgi:hypothetical protein
MDVDIDLENLKALGAFYGFFPITPAEFPLITLPVARTSFAKRFAIAIEYNGWHPGFFAAIFRSDEWTTLAAQANESGKTALHWAVEDHWAFISSATLAIELIKQGSDVHACWYRPSLCKTEPVSKASPFTVFLEGTPDFQGWNTASLSNAVLRWGQILVEAGQSLAKYAAAENDFYRANGDVHFMLDGYGCSLVRLEVLGDDRLAVRVKHTTDVTIWKAIPIHVPGAWPASLPPPDPIIWMPELPDTIIWHPKDKEEQEGFRWARADTMRIKVHSHLVESPAESDLIQLGASRGRRGSEPHRIIVDDHDLSLITITNADRSRQRAQKYTRRRTASAPAVINKPRIGRRNYGFPESWNCRMHQCALDTRWRVSDSGSPKLRDCMQARCREWTGSSNKNNQWYMSWEADLLRDERHVQVARRFAQRFCPQYLRVVERTSARVAERARLAMGPARPQARPW